MIHRDLLLKMIEEITMVIGANKQYLTDLDQTIGDGDHGINMDRGFRAIKDKVEAVKDKDCGTILKTVAMGLISTVGGASGPLYGTAFMKAGQVVANKMEITAEDAVKILDEAIQGIIARGKAAQGDKTMLDALIPAYDALKAAVEEGEPLTNAMGKAVEAAEGGVAYTKTIAAKKGRANYLGDRSIGHQDPGATSSYLMLKAIYDVLTREA
ncbi:dihydroxyacetone kinase DhaL subunit [Geosporobacter subterraneus DSM 17957]|uniref:phosphoenolpyruvate--glycerone phosphotransferase n=1 Tax=Geosporobacter subterraneus DSM 17957 TaxID=1121919 RepID=A0A1M6QJ98_9FIRM|nr:dihydroxyacetone kinase subunit DhaL [Geosporobacter subterraneus]SHK20143.1 dihydroxyacetone kinase DhaL subunit [Geosporobacter subterraneus DSM 17957]